MRSPYLATQATSIGVVDRYIESMEGELLKAYMQDERTPDWTILVVALSQMWVFSLYELLRTWRQMASELVRYADDLDKLTGDARDKRIARERERIEKVQSHVGIPDRSYDACFAAVETDPEFGKQIRVTLAASEDVYREVETLRVTMAKHEVPKTKGMRAQGAGYGRIDLSSGSIYWMVVLKDGSSTIISRRSLADRLRGGTESDDGEPPELGS